MTDEVTPTAEPTDQQQATELIAGKYKDHESFENGVREIATKVGSPLNPNVPVFGENGIYPDLPSAVKGYENFNRQLRTPTTPPKVDISPTPTSAGQPDILSDPDPVSTPSNIGMGSIIQESKVDYGEAVRQYEEHGALTSNQLRSIQSVMKARGLPSDKWSIEQGMAAETAKYSRNRDEAIRLKQGYVNELGGEEGWNNLVSYAKSTYSEAEVAKLQGILTDPTFGPKAVKLLAAEMQEAGQAQGGQQQQPKVLDGQTSAPPSVQGLRTQKEYIKLYKETDGFKSMTATQRAILLATNENQLK